MELERRVARLERTNRAILLVGLLAYDDDGSVVARFPGG